MIQEIYKKVLQSKEFNDYSKQSPKSYLVHFLNMSEKPDTWFVGYFEPQKESMTSFVVDNDSIALQKEGEVFRETKEKISQLSLDDVKKDFEEAKMSAEKFRLQKYPKELPLQTIYVLQNLKDFGQVWNVTVFSRTFKTVNMKFDAKTGEIKKHDVAKLFEFDSGDAKEANKDQADYIG